MKGIIFNLTEEIVVASHGEDSWDQLLENAGLDGVYTALGSYPTEELVALVDAAASLFGVEPAAVLRDLGEGAIPLLAVRYPPFFEGHTSTRSFMLTLNDVIHAEVRKLYPDAKTPEFAFDTSDPTSLLVEYRSPRRLCALAEGFTAGAARHFGEHRVAPSAHSVSVDPSTHRVFFPLEDVRGHPVLRVMRPNM